jgi:hypothetical protein
VSLPWYATREDVKLALDSHETSRNNGRIDRLLAAASRRIDRSMARQFYPEYATKLFDWPNPQMGTSYRLWLDRQELISISQLKAGGNIVAPSNYSLEPNRTGPPFSRIELSLATLGSFAGNALTPQNSVSVRGTFGYGADTTPAGTLTAPIASDTTTTISVSDSGLIGVGDTILIESEYLQVTEKRMADTGQTGSLAKDSAAVTLAVANGAVFDVNEVLLLDAERVLITDIAGNNLIVKRAWDGTVLAAHASSALFAGRTLVVTRGTLGTAASTHSALAIARHTPPDLIRQLCIAEVLNSLQQEASGYQSVQQRARQVGASGSARGAMTQVYPIDDLRNAAATSYARQSRTRVIA